MSRMEHVMLFLGNEMFFPMLNKTKRYNLKHKSKKADYPTLQDNPSQGDGQVDLILKELMPKTMSTLEDQYVANLFVAIIDLMQYICLQSELYKHQKGNQLF